jgi:nucleoside 2-deoxyribosyltransferase
MPKIYLAGPDVFLPNAKQHGEALKAVLAKSELEGVFPLDAELDVSSSAENIFKACYRLIRECQGVIANISPFRGPSMDVGTSWEMGYAFALGLPIIAYTSDNRPYKERVKVYRELTDAAYPLPKKPFDDPEFVEDFKLSDNLMIDCSTMYVVGNIERAAQLMSQSLKAGLGFTPSDSP